MKSDTVVVLHVSIVTPVDLGRLQRELYTIDSLISNSKSDYKHHHVGYISESLDTLLKSVGVDVDNSAQRKNLINQLQLVRKTAPVVQMTFANEPDKSTLSMLVKWFRENGHPNTLIAVGVQPKITGGCIVRTQTKTFDFSLSSKLKNSPVKIQFDKLPKLESQAFGTKALIT